MKTVKLLLASALLAGIATLGFAGQSPDAWTRANKPAKSQPQVTAPTATPAPATCANCACCTGMKKA
jgi:hypothetical protein